MRDTSTVQPSQAEITPALLVERAAQLTPILAERAAEAQQNRNISADSVADIQRAGLFKILQPRRWGGYAMDPQVFFDVQFELSRGCMSTAWIYGVISVHNWQIALFALKAQEDVWHADNSILMASSYMPVGKVEPLQGGYNFSGRWSFSSGCGHCDWALLGGMVPPNADNSAPEFRTFLVPKSDYKIVDTWKVFGLQGTGSNDIVVENAFVPEHRTHSSLDGFRGTNPGPDSHEVPLFMVPFGQLFPRAVGSAAIGALQGAIDTYRLVASKRVGSTDGAKTAADPIAQMAVARAQSTVDSLRLSLHDAMAELMTNAQAGVATDINKRIQYRYEAAAVAEQCLIDALELQKACGGRAIFIHSPLQRFVLDILAGRAHVANNPYKYGSNFGAVQLGLDNSDFFL